MRARVLALLVLGGCNDYDLVRPDEKNVGTEPEVTDPTDPVEAEPDIEVSPLSLDFGGLPKDCASDPQVITITNVGEGPLEVDAVDLAGEGVSAFALSGVTVPFTLAAGESVQVEVVFEPGAWVSYSPAVKVGSNDPDEAEVEVALDGYGADDAFHEQSFVQDYHEMLDVLWVVDNSGSMSDDLRTVSANFESFITVFTELDADWQVAVITTDMDNPTDSGRIEGPIISAATADPVAEFIAQVDQGSSGSGTEQGFSAVMAALTDPLLSGTNAGIMRADAALAVVVISDEDDSSFTGADSFSTWFTGLKADDDWTTFSAICEDFFISCYKYGEAADTTGGIVGDIASTDYITVLEDISMTSAGLTVSFDLEQVPSDLARMSVVVAGTAVDQDITDGWTYDSRDNAVIFHGDSIPAPGESGVISYPVATECPTE
ncbi:choice-of-anchor D domain-containing protein [Myxococcota bacterium]|nr:choice-of-anchor D domain-containing protein [Myxococcota bacterium]